MDLLIDLYWRIIDYINNGGSVHDDDDEPPDYSCNPVDSSDYDRFLRQSVLEKRLAY